MVARAGQSWVWVGVGRSHQGPGGGARRVQSLSSALALHDGDGRLKKGRVMPWWPLSSMPGWKDPKGGLGKAGGLEEIRGEGRWLGGGTHPALSSPLLSLPQAWGQLPSPSVTRERVGGTERLAAAWGGCSALRTAAAQPAGLTRDGLCRSSYILSWRGGAAAIKYG